MSSKRLFLDIYLKAKKSANNLREAVLNNDKGFGAPDSSIKLESTTYINNDLSPEQDWVEG